MAEGGSLTPSRKELFVRNLPYSTRDSDLETVFSEYGPVKSCFTVKGKGVVDQCRGFGYVTFAIREDAERAKSAVKMIGGRPVQISFAKRKPPKKVRRREQRGGAIDDYRSGSDGEESDDYETRTARSAGSSAKQHKKKSQRGAPRFDIGKTVVLKNLPEATTEEKIRKWCSEYERIEDVSYPVPQRETPTAFITFSTHKQARKAVTGLNRLSPDGSHAVLLSRENKIISEKTLKKSKLIVRNLSFKCTGEDLKEVFSPYGEILVVHIPQKPNGHMFGYAFVQFTTYISAFKALEGVNMKEIKGRPVAVDWVVPKEQYERSRQVQEEEKPEEQDEGERNEAEDGSSSSEEEVRTSVEEGGESLGESEGESNSEAESEEEESSDEEEKRERKSFKEDVHEGKTLFIRNVPFDADEDELRKILSQFGSLRYCRLVLDSQTDMCKGSAFAQFFNLDAAQRCLDTGSGLGIRYGSRALDVSVALSKQEVEREREKRKGKKEKVDKRNLYLATEGVIAPNSEAAEDLSKSDLVKRNKAQAEKKAKLANPNHFVSRTRLSVRNLPTQVDEKKLRALFLKAAGGPPAKVRQVKILRSTERVDSEGVGRSKGYAFVEFSTHSAALNALRATNNNPELFGSKKRLIVEFAVEDSRALKRRKQKQQQQVVLKNTSSRDKKLKEEEAYAAGTKPKVLSKRVKWRMKWKSKRLQRRQRDVNASPPEKAFADMDDKEPEKNRLANGNNGEGKRKRCKQSLLKKHATSKPTSVDVGSSSETSHCGKRKQAIGPKTGNKRTSSSLTDLESEMLPAQKKKKAAKKTVVYVSDASNHSLTDQKRMSTQKRSSVLSVIKPKQLHQKSRKRKRQREDEREEREFAAMVDQYKQKLFGNISDSRWFE